MPEAEDVITDAARHATVFAQELWRRHRPGTGDTVDVPVILHRLDLLIVGSYGRSFRLRLSQPPATIPFVRKVFSRAELPAAREPVAATDGESIWLPVNPSNSIDVLRVLALEQAARARRQSPALLASLTDPVARSGFEILEAHAADEEIVQMFPGMALRIAGLRRACLRSRPPVEAFPLVRRPLEIWFRSILELPLDGRGRYGPAESMERANRVAHELLGGEAPAKGTLVGRLFRDCWIGELREPSKRADLGRVASASDDAAGTPVRSARMPRRPNVRKPDERDERTNQGAWMVQTAQPHEHAEDPFGSQRPTDRDEQQAAEEFADSLSELAEARLVSVPGAPKEILLSDDAPVASARKTSDATPTTERVLWYPEWDWRSQAYRDPGAAVHVTIAPQGSSEWVDRTLEEHRSLLQTVRRQFESLRAQRTRLHQQREGDELDLAACVDAFCDLRAGSAMERGLYRCTRTSQRELAVLLLIDVSGSTDGWVSQHRRVIDVEREALLLVCLAMDSLAEPYSVLAFSGESAQGVTVRSVKGFRERYGKEVGSRIAGLEPEKYTRMGAAIRHASSILMREPARHRLLLLLSDGKPNDSDEYDGRYGVEDMRQSIVEARLQGIFPFCLAIDRHTAGYLSAVFGEHQYAVLHRPALLPSALLGWLRRLVQA